MLNGKWGRVKDKIEWHVEWTANSDEWNRTTRCFHLDILMKEWREIFVASHFNQIEWQKKWDYVMERNSFVYFITNGLGLAKRVSHL